MKNLVSVVFVMVVGFFITGCSIKGSYESKYINGVKKTNLNKVDSKVIVKESSENVLSRKPSSLRAGGVTVKVDAGEIGDKVTKDFFSQYFKNVNISRETSNANLLVDYEIRNFKVWIRSFNDGSKVEIDARIKVLKENKLILEKNYVEIFDSGAMLELIGVSLDSVVNETINKAVISMYERQIKPDLLKALKENI